jgi:hypothetical protein
VDRDAPASFDLFLVTGKPTLQEVQSYEQGVSRLKRSTVALILFGILLLSSCNRRKPDFIYTEKSLDGSRLAIVQGFQPRGTLEGHVLISFKTSDHESARASFSQIENGEVGWVTGDTFVAAADRIRFDSVSSEYYPDGTTGSRVKFIVCNKSEMDCSELLKRLRQSTEVQVIRHFPEN